MFSGPGCGLGGVKGEGLEGDKFEWTAHSGPEVVAPVKGEKLMPVVKLAGFGAGDELFGDGVRTGDFGPFGFAQDRFWFMDFGLGIKF